MQPKVLGAILAASLGWGLAGVAVRALFEEGVTTFTVVVIRTAIATVTLLGVYLAIKRPVSRRAWRDGALIGIPRIALAPSFFVASLNYISAGFEGLVITLIPVVTAAMAHVFLRERLHRNQAIGLSLGLAGTMLLIASGETGIADGSGSTVIGGALALVGVFFGALSVMLSRRFAPDHDTMTLAVPMFVSGMIVAGAIGLLSGDFDLGSANTASWGLLLVLGIASTLLPFLATLYAVRHTTAARASLSGYLAPVIGVAGGALLLDEVIAPMMFIGGVFAIAGVVLVARRSPVTVMIE